MDIEEVTNGIEGSLDKEPRAVVYAGLRGEKADITMDGARHLRKEQYTMLIGALIRRYSGIFGVHEAVVSHDATQYAIDSRGGGE